MSEAGGEPRKVPSCDGREAVWGDGIPTTDAEGGCGSLAEDVGRITRGSWVPPSNTEDGLLGVGQ